VVRVTAANTLLHAGDPSGLAEIFRAAMSEDRDVYKIAETAILKKVMVWDPDHPQAGMLEPGKNLVPAYPLGQAEVEALVPMLQAEEWYLRRAALFLVGLSGRSEPIEPLRARLKVETGNNLNRVIGALGALRAREAVTSILWFLERGPSPTFRGGHGDRAEQRAAPALVRIGDPACVEPVIELLASDKPTVPRLARRTLSRLFVPDIEADREIVPRDGQLSRLRIDNVPDYPALQKAWQAFWGKNREHYVQNKEGEGLVRDGT
jgi:HEAT repeat protein